MLRTADREAARSAQRRIRAAVLDAGAPDADDADDAALREAEAHTAGEPPVAVAAHWDVAVDPATVRTLLAAVAERAGLDIVAVIAERDVRELDRALHPAEPLRKLGRPDLRFLCSQARCPAAEH